MKSTLFSAVITALAIIFTPGLAHAQTAADQVALCAAALDAEGVAAADDYRARFLKSKGGAVKTVTVRLLPTANGAEAIEAECQIRRGEVVEVAVKA